MATWAEIKAKRQAKPVTTSQTKSWADIKKSRGYVAPAVIDKTTVGRNMSQVRQPDDVAQAPNPAFKPINNSESSQPGRTNLAMLNKVDEPNLAMLNQVSEVDKPVQKLGVKKLAETTLRKGVSEADAGTIKLAKDAYNASSIPIRPINVTIGGKTIDVNPISQVNKLLQSVIGKPIRDAARKLGGSIQPADEKYFNGSADIGSEALQNLQDSLSSESTKQQGILATGTKAEQLIGSAGAEAVKMLPQLAAAYLTRGKSLADIGSISGMPGSSVVEQAASIAGMRSPVAGLSGSTILEAGKDLTAMAPFGVQALGGYVSDAESKGASIPQQYAAAIPQASLEVITEMVPFGMFKKVLGVSDDLVKAAAKAGSKKATAYFGELAKAEIFNMATQVVQEVGINPFTAAIEKAVYNPDMPWTGEGGVLDAKSAVETAKITGVMTLMLSALGLPVSFRSHQAALQMLKDPSVVTSEQMNRFTADTQADLAQTQTAANPLEAAARQMANKVMPESNQAEQQIIQSEQQAQLRNEEVRKTIEAIATAPDEITASITRAQGQPMQSESLSPKQTKQLQQEIPLTEPINGRNIEDTGGEVHATRILGSEVGRSDLRQGLDGQTLPEELGKTPAGQNNGSGNAGPWISRPGNSGSVQRSALTSKIQAIFDEKNIGYADAQDVADPNVFHSAISAAQKNNTHGAYVHVYEPAEYAQHAKNFTFDNGKMGVSVKPDGDIVSAFKDPSSTVNSGVSQLMITALEHGGTKLDNFDGRLSTMYAQHGFVPVSRVKFDTDFAPEGWNYARDNHPDIVFWKHSGETPDIVANKIGAYPDVKQAIQGAPMFDTYDEAQTYRDERIDGQSKTEANVEATQPITDTGDNPVDSTNPDIRYGDRRRAELSSPRLYSRMFASDVIPDTASI